MNIKVTGQIGETNSFFDLPLKDPITIQMDLSEMTYISSIGVKNWISWSTRFPRGSKVVLEKCPFVIVSQASMVAGFAPPEKFTINSFSAPFSCEKCSFEKNEMMRIKVHYDYAANDVAGWLKTPEEMKCPKCAHPMEPDFFIEKVLKVLDQKPLK